MVEIGPPKRAGKLDHRADQIDRSTAVLVHARNKQKTADSEPGVAAATGLVEGRIGQAQLFHVPSVRETVDVDQHECEQDIGARQRKVDCFPQGRPVLSARKLMPLIG